jgi:hypothetical protein
MKIGIPQQPNRRTAIVAGFSYLISLVIVVYVNFGIHDRLIVVDNPSETARHILSQEQLFRIGIAGDILYCACIVVLLTALYILLRSVNPALALLGALMRLVWVLMWLVMTLNLFDVLRLLHEAAGVRPADAGQLQVLASLKLKARFDYYYVGLLYGSIASTVCGYLWLKSRYVPRALSLFGLISSAWCVFCTLVFYVFPHFDDTVNLWWFDSPMAIFDILISFWLIIKGIRIHHPAK